MPTAARKQGLQPYGALTLFFRWRKKSVQKKASGTATLAARPAMRRGLRSAAAPSGLSSTLVRFAHPSGKKALIAHFDGGARNVARNGVGWLTHTGGARSCSPFSAVKMGGPFSLRCLSPLGSPAVGTGQTQPMRVGMLHCSLDGFAAQKTVLIFSSALGTMPTQPALLRILRSILDILATQNASAESNPRWHFLRAGGPVARRRSFLFN